MNSEDEVWLFHTPLQQCRYFNAVDSGDDMTQRYNLFVWTLPWSDFLKEERRFRSRHCFHLQATKVPNLGDS
jgi:hypothetical protein